MIHKIIALFLSFVFLFSQSGFAQVSAELNIASRLGQMSSVLSVDKFRPVHLRYFSYNTNTDDYRIILDRGDQENLDERKLKRVSNLLLKYFLIGVTLPNESFWVNLRPDSPQNIIDEELAKTDMGRVMLEADVELKKDTAKFTSPQTAEGRKYWDKLYKRAGEIFGSENVDIPTLIRPWIVPNEVIVRETQDSAYIYKATMKVMLEQDHLKNSDTFNFKDERLKQLNEYSAQLVRELIIPKLTKEVNSSRRYSALRQVFYSLALSRWFKSNFNGKPGIYPALIDKKELNKLTSQNAWSRDSYFKEYQRSFKQGEYNIKEPVHTPTGQVIRTYFSGGISFYTKSSSPLAPGVYRSHKEPGFLDALKEVGAILWSGNSRRSDLEEVDEVYEERPLTMPATTMNPFAWALRKVGSWVGLSVDPDHMLDLARAYHAEVAQFPEILDIPRNIQKTRERKRDPYLDSGAFPIGAQDVRNPIGSLECNFTPDSKHPNAPRSQSEAEMRQIIYQIVYSNIPWDTPLRSDKEKVFTRKFYIFAVGSQHRDTALKVLRMLAGYCLTDKMNTTNIVLVSDGLKDGLDQEDQRIYLASSMQNLSQALGNKLVDETSNLAPGNIDVQNNIARRKGADVAVVCIDYFSPKLTDSDVKIGSGINQVLEHFLLENPRAYIFETATFLQESIDKSAQDQPGQLSGGGVKLDTFVDRIGSGAYLDASMRRFEEYQRTMLKSLYVNERNPSDPLNPHFVKDTIWTYTYGDNLERYQDRYTTYIEAHSVKDGETERKWVRKEFTEEEQERIGRLTAGVDKVGKTGSSPVGEDNFGGIDFRAMNLICQPMGIFEGLSFKLPTLKNISAIDLDKEFSQIQAMLDTKTIPAGERVKEFIAACYQKDEITKRRDDIELILLQVCRLQEDEDCDADPQLRESLVIMDTNKFVI